MTGATATLREVVSAGVRRALGEVPGTLEEYASPTGDAGLFGPDSFAWQVHADLPAMLIGGVAALLFQTLHPLAMAGVAAHSRFREDPLGRLQRTARFVAGTTFGPTALADELIEHVRAVHERVRGFAPDGRPYAASDPELLTFVHVTEVTCFLAAYQRYALRPLLGHEKDAYLAELATVARRLGAEQVPTSRAAMRRYFAAISPELGQSEQARQAQWFLEQPLGDRPAEAAAHRIVVRAAYDVLPPWVRARLGYRRSLPSTRAATRAAAGSFALALRWALGPSPVVALSTQRCARRADPQGERPAGRA